jgi:hypothetical protein
LARLLNIPASGARIRRDGTGAATVFGQYARYPHHRLMVSLAGGLAERMVSKTALDGGDRFRIRAMADHFDIPSYRVSRLKRITKAKLNRYRDAVDAVAAALLHRRYLTGEEIDRLIEKAGE